MKVERNPNCDRCTLSSSANTICVWGEKHRSGNRRPNIVVVGEAPGKEEDEGGRPFIGRSGQLLRAIIEECRLEDVYITNIVKCRPPNNRPPKLAEQRACATYLESELAELRPEYIVLLGASAIKAITGERTVSVGHYRNRASWEIPTGSHKSKVIATYHPAAALRDPSLISKIVDDFQRINSKEFTNPESVKVHVVDKVTKAMISKIMALDLETTGLNPFADGKILCASWSGKNDEAYVTKDIEGLVRCIYQVNPKLIGHNFKFDLLWLRKCTGFSPVNYVYDTMIMAHLVDENLPSKGLKYLASIHTGYGEYSKDVMSSRSQGKMEELNENQLMEYCAYDAAATWRIYKYYLPIIKDEGLSNLFAEQSELLSTMVNVEARGIQIDRELLVETRASLSRRERYLSTQIRKVAPGLENLDSPKQVSEFIYKTMGLPILDKTEKGHPSVGEDALVKLSKISTMDKITKKFLDMLIERRSIKKTLSTYIDGLEETLDGNDFCHPSFNITGTVTGRFSCSSPNLQNIPRDGNSPVKNLFISGKGYKLVQADYSQIELRIGAYLSRDSSMLSLLRGGVDLHSATAGRLFSCDLGKVTKEQRYLAKTINFGIFYGMGPKRFHEETGTPMHQASKFIKSWYAMYPGVRAWLEEIEKELLENGYVTSLFGRRRRLPVNVTKDEGAYRHMVRQACNFPVQSVASEITQMAMVQIDKAGFRVVGNVHDSVLVVCNKADVKSCVKTIRSVMENPEELVRQFGFKMKIDVPTPVEVKIGDNWGDMEVINGK